MLMTKAKFDTSLASIKSRGVKITTEFSDIVITGIQLYYGETNRNIQVINDLIDCAAALKGLRVKGLVEYLSQTIPHTNLGSAGAHQFGKIDKHLKHKMETTWKDFLVEHPHWHEFTEEKDPKPFDLIAFLKTIKKRIDKAHADGSMDSDELSTFKTEVSKFAFTEADADKPDM